MRIAVLSDVHANLSALEAVRGDLPEVDQVWVLGDIVGYGPQPNEVIAALQEMGARSVLGNHDGAAIGTVDAAYFNPDARNAIEWTAGAIDDNARSYLATLPEVRCDGDLTAVHGSPRDPIWEYITSSAIAAANFDSFETSLCLFGHTHLPAVYRLVDGAVEALPGLPGEVLSLAGGRALLNPGSVGQPRDGDPRAAWLELDTEGWTARYHRVPYDVAGAAEAILAAGLPSGLAERLGAGR